jgi:TetR/AcrR family transcriptional regulator
MKADRSQAKFDQILDAAQRRFGHYGLSKTTMNDIAEDIGMSKASLYYYFKDKESIFQAVMRKEQDHFVREMGIKISETLQAELMLKEYVNLRLALLKKLFTLGHFSYGGLMEVKPLMHELLKDFRKEEIKMISSVLESGVKKKEFLVENINKDAEFFVDILHSIRKAALADYGDGDIIDFPPKKYQRLKEQSNMFVAIFIKGIAVHTG